MPKDCFFLGFHTALPKNNHCWAVLRGGQANKHAKSKPNRRQILYPDPPLLSKSVRPSWQGQKETQKTEAAWDPMGKGWLRRPFLPLAAVDPGEKPSGLTFRGPSPASVLVSTSCWSCFGRSPSLSSPCCGRKVQGVLAAGSSFAPPSALHTGSLSLPRIC